MSRDSATTVHRTQLPTPAHAHNATPHDTRTRVKAEVPLVIGYGASGRANAWHGCCPCAHTPRMESASTQRHAVWLHEGKLLTCKCRRRSARRSQRTLACAFSQRGVQEKATARTPHLSCACIALIMFASLPLRSMWRARSAQGKAPAVRERGSMNRMRADGAGDACAPREFALIGSCSSRRWTDGRSSAPCHHVLWSSKSGTLFSDLLSACTDLILKGASFAAQPKLAQCRVEARRDAQARVA